MMEFPRNKEADIDSEINKIMTAIFLTLSQTEDIISTLPLASRKKEVYKTGRY